MTVSTHKYLTRAAVPDYVREKYGDPAVVTAKSLAKFAVYGGGPRFTKFGRKVGYATDDVDEWVENRARHHSSTSET